MEQEQFDILIIGGGITGAGVALDGASRGLKCALVEKRDFAAGTSSRSTKLIHGGLRYLEHFDFHLVREALAERSTLLRTASYLVEPLSFLVPIYSDNRKNYDRPLKIRAGLWLYDLLAGRKRMGRHKKISKDEVLKLAPQLGSSDLTSGFTYYDGLTNDARLVLEIIKTAHNHGAIVANYTKVLRLNVDRSGTIIGARLRDEVTATEFDIKAKIAINATGVWLDETADLADKSRHKTNRERYIRPSKGIHLVVSRERMNVSAALLIPSLHEHRFYFVVPWQGAVVIGTTDTDYAGDLDSPMAKPEEVNEILAAINVYFPGLKLRQSDIISTFAGLRPLVNSSSRRRSKDLTRAEDIYEDTNSLISIAGGKLTTYRLMAERTIDHAARRLMERFGHHPTYDSKTSKIAIGDGNRASVDQTLAGETIQAVQFEMAMTIADVLARRTRLALVEGLHSLDVAGDVAALMARELGWSEAERQHQLASFKDEFNREYRIPTD